MAQFNDLLGKMITKIEGEKGGDSFEFWTSDNKHYRMYHSQSCCESVKIEDICGDINDLIDSPILQAEESTNDEKHPDDYKPDYKPESFTWTFYRIATIRGQVVIRWLGKSNGYYSESVDFEELTA